MTNLQGFVLLGTTAVALGPLQQSVCAQLQPRFKDGRNPCLLSVMQRKIAELQTQQARSLVQARESTTQALRFQPQLVRAWPQPLTHWKSIQQSPRPLQNMWATSITTSEKACVRVIARA